jgi:MoaA/NifB/PqqE/SkfB family radical SAM enzyme
MYVPNAPLVLGIDLTRKCNISCRHCILDASEKDDSLPFEQAKSLVDQASQLDVQSLDLDGGEPLLYPGFFSLVKYALEKGLKIIFVSNGILISENLDEIKKCFAKYGPALQIGISLDGHNAETHGYFRPKETFAVSVEAIKSLISIGIEPIVFCVVNHSNIKWIKEFLQFLSSLGVSRVRLLPFIPFGKGATLGYEMLSYEEICWIIRNKEKWKNEFMGHVSFGALHEFVMMPDEQIKTSYCMAGFVQLGVSTSGDYYPCAHMMDCSMGTIYKNSIKEIWRDSPVLKSLRKDGGCDKCRYRSSIVNYKI